MKDYNKIYERKGLLPLSFLTSLSDETKPNIYETINDVNVKITSQRYPVFKKNSKCVCCGLEASYLLIDKKKSENENTENYHLNMYGLKDGNEMLFTKDHIIPKTKGGKNIQSNYQTMCENCNFEKGNMLI